MKKDAVAERVFGSPQAAAPLSLLNFFLGVWCMYMIVAVLLADVKKQQLEEDQAAAAAAS
ncbi:hypothetical protein OsI_25227 [Oryza sativa Indica Group]|uniref:Uncharacterized protein n=2 Tax=Oryza sativa TaxID=4530 RepID=A3BHF4_ORYSJ|nr:hypothetical protein OsI_25227 [Oryza sativa Indica Group]EAZ38993.1 hypothetical protein OsJ_23412 [Oryza sativa Japonica Group]